MPNRSYRHRGFTLIEQVATIAIMSILVGLATPALARLVSRSAVRSTENALFAALRLARSTAVQRDAHSLFCPSRDGRHCSGGTDWQQGWIVAYDLDHDRKADGPPVMSGQPDADHVRVLGSAGRPQVRFRADGAASGTNLTLLVCPRDAGHGAARAVIVSNSGRIREARASAEQQARCASDA